MASLERFWSIVDEVWSTALFGTGVGPMLAALVVFAGFIFARGLFTRIVLKFLAGIAKRTKNEFDDQLVEALERPLRFVFVILGIFFAGEVAPFPPDVSAFLDKLVRSLVAFTVFWTLYRCVQPLSFLIDRATSLIGGRLLGESLTTFFVKVIKFALACLGAAAVLEEWEFNVAALLGGLGLVGMAVAFGAQNLISNLFAGVAIFLDRMFEEGHWIRAGDVEGTVEDIGFRTTKIRRFDKAQVTVPNSVLTGGAIINFSRMTNRRIYWMVGLEYGSSEAQLRAVVQGISTYIHENEDFETDPARTTTLINVDSFNASSIDIMLYCFTRTTRWGEWMEVKERLAFEIKRIVEQAGTGFAFPSTSIYLEKWPFGQPEAFTGTAPEAPAD